MEQQTVSANFSHIGRRDTYNSVLQHMIQVTDMVKKIGNKGENLADILNDLIDNGKMTAEQILPIVSVLLVQKFGYDYQAFNLMKNLENFDDISQELEKWAAIDMVLVYFPSNEGVCVINPKRKSHWNEKIQYLSQKELLVAYAKANSPDAKSSDEQSLLSQKALDVLCNILSGKAKTGIGDTQVFARKIAQAPTPRPATRQSSPSPQQVPTGQDPSVQSGFESASASAHWDDAKGVQGMDTERSVRAQSPTPGKKVQMTPKYSVQVTNELFHNGNVEAWKNIITSYHIRYPQLRVLVFYEGEYIQDLNALFKWGKVKHGGVLIFQVSGQEVKGVSRLQKYLFEGASQRYENFLKKDLHRHLDLF